MSRIAEISAFLFHNGETSVSDLAEKIGASLATIRRDLAQMETLGSVERVHGAARLAPSVKAETGHRAREDRNLTAKRAIAQRAYGLLTPGATILLDAGTTVLQLARQIRLMPLPLTVVTNGLAVAQELSDLPQVDVNILGGRLRPGHLSVVGPLAEAMLQGLWLDQAFIGASAVPSDGWITSFDADEARLNLTMSQRANRLTLLADHSKFGPRATYAVRQLAPGDTVITDLPPPCAADLGQSGVALLYPLPTGP